MIRPLAAALLVAASAASAQVTSNQTSRPDPLEGDPDKIVCKKVEKIGTRLGASKVCLTVREWTARAKNDRHETERIQSITNVCKALC